MRESYAAPEGAPTRMSGMVDAVRAGDFLFLSAVRGREPRTGAFADGIEDQTRQAFSNLGRSLSQHGLGMGDVVKVTVFLGDLALRTGFHAVWQETFGDRPPARIVVQVSDPNPVPDGKALFALDVIAYVGDRGED